MDALSDLLQAIKLTGGVFLDVHVHRAWCISSGIGPEDCRPFLADPVQVIAYHYVARGRMRVRVAGESDVEVRAGEAVLLPRNDPHVLGSAIDLRPVSADDLVQPGDGGGLSRIIHGRRRARPRTSCAASSAATSTGNPLTATLPRLLTIDMTLSGIGRVDRIVAALRDLRIERGENRKSSVMSKLSELMFVEAVRRYAATLPAEQQGWLAVWRDPYVGKALALVHGKPSHPWTAQSLAGEVSLSRSAFADRFTAVVGMPPKRYLISWRLQVAKEKLRAGRQPIAQIAYDVGYEAEAAFIRAFKREFGVPPAAWRRQTQPTKM